MHAHAAEIAESKSPECLQCHQVLGSGASTPNRPFSGPKLYQKEKFKPLFCQSLNFQAGYRSCYSVPEDNLSLRPEVVTRQGAELRGAAGERSDPERLEV